MNIGIEGRNISILGGVGLYVSQLIKNISTLRQDNNKILLFTRAKAFPPFDLKGINNIKLIISNPLIWSQLSIPAALVKNNIDIYHGTKNTLPFITKKNTKYVVTIHDIVMFELPKLFTLTEKVYWFFSVKNAIKKANIIITVSKSTKQSIIKRYKAAENKIRVIPLGVDCHKFYPTSEKDKQKIKALYDLPEKYILYVGNKRPNKNLKRLLLAYKNLLTNYPRAPKLLLVIGIDSDKKFNLRSYIDKMSLSEKIVILENLEDDNLRQVYAAAELFIYPSLYEGFGLPVLEAMASGVPVIASNTSSIKEVAGEAGYLINPYNTKDITDSLRVLIENDRLRQELIRKGLTRAKQFSWEKMAKETYKIYQELS